MKQNLDELAFNLCSVIESYDPYEYRNSDYSIEQAKADIENDPKSVIAYLINIIGEEYGLWN